jgi:hypothetical protein
VSDSAFSFDSTGNLADAGSTDSADASVPVFDSLDALAAAPEDAPAFPMDPLNSANPPQVSFARAGVMPPTPLYVTQDDSLRITVWADVQLTQVALTLRLLEPNGEIHQLVWTFNCQTNTIPNFFTRVLSEGFVLDATLVTFTSGTKRGQCFARVSVFRGVSVGLMHHGVLFQGYLTTACFLQFPGGQIHDSTEGPGAIVNTSIANPAAGVDWVYTVPLQHRARIMAIRAVLQTSATVATRSALMQCLDSAGNVLLTIEPAASQAASLLWAYNYAPGMPSLAVVANNMKCPFPENMILTAGQKVSPTTLSIQAADQWSAIWVTVEQWWEPDATG